MSGGIEEPYIIAQLPRPLDAEHGCILAAPVHSISASRKRKRHEVAIGVDGESVSVYNTQNQSLSSSYALPPQSFLAAPPCSVYCKRTKSLQSQRHTYFAIRDSPFDQKLRLVSITEDQGRLQGGDRVPKTPAKRERKLRAGQVAGLDVIAARNESPQEPNDGIAHSILVSYRNGNVDCLCGDLSGSRWEHTATTNNDAEVEFAVTLDLATARKGLLRGREDALAMFDTMGNDDSPLLFQVLRSGPQRQARLFALRNAAEDSLQTRRSPMEEILSYELPTQKKYDKNNVRYELHAGAGMMYQLMGGHLSVFDLSGTFPKLSAGFGRNGTPRIKSFARLSSATILAVSPNRIAVHETRFGSILSSLEYSSAGPEDTANEKGPTLNIISQFTELGIVVALSGTNLLAFQVGDILDDGRRTKAQGALLIDVLGKGKNTHSWEPEKLSGKQIRKRQKWEDWTANVDSFVSANDIKGMEGFLAEELHLDLTGASESSDGPTNGAGTSVKAGVWEFPPRTYDPQHVEAKKASYMTGAMFAWRATDERYGSSESNLRLKLVSKNVLRWLGLAGYLTPFELERALPKTAPGHEGRPRVVPGDVLAAVKDAESTFELICDLLTLPIHWGLAEIMQGLAILIGTFDPKPTPTAHNLLTSDNVTISGLEEEARLQAEVEVANRQLEEAQSLLDTGVDTRSKTARALIHRLHAFPKSEVTREMQALLSQDQLIFFIAILRLELSNAGWTKKYAYAAGEEETDETPVGGLDGVQDLIPSNQAIRTIADMFCCAIDAIGLSGWLVGLSGDLDEMASLVAASRNEVEAAAECLFGAEVVHGLLQELLKTAAQVQETKHDLKRKRPHDEQLISEDKMLPLGSRLEPPDLKSRKAADGRKSKHVAAIEKSRSVGKYSFERIRL